MRREEQVCVTEHLTNYNVRALDRAIAILTELAAEPFDLGNVELSNKLHLHKSTVHRLLAVLGRAGLVERISNRGGYRLGWKAWELGVSASLRLEVLELARPHLAQLSETAGETVHMGVILHRSTVVSLAAVRRPGTPTPPTVGRHLPPHCVAIGKAILAFLPAEEVERVLKLAPLRRHTANTIVDRDRFFTELTLIRERGYAIDNQEFEDGWRCVAAPIRHSSGTPVAAVSVAGPIFHMPSKRLPGLGRAAIRTAAEISGACDLTTLLQNCGGN